MLRSVEKRRTQGRNKIQENRKRKREEKEKNMEKTERIKRGNGEA
jgi:hypothetical protein